MRIALAIAVLAASASSAHAAEDRYGSKRTAPPDSAAVAATLQPYAGAMLGWSGKSAAPFVLQGHKVAASLAVVGAVVAEFSAGSGGSQGLAWRILEASNRLQTAKAFAALFVLAVMGAGLYALLQIAERRALIWWRGR